MTPRSSVKRLYFLLSGAILLAALVMGHLFRIQVLEHQQHLAEADRQHKRKLVLPPRRGDILDRSGRPLALSAEGLNVYAVPEQIKDKRAAARALARSLGLPESQLYRRINRDRPFVMIQQKVNPLELAGLRAQRIEGIGFIPSSKRYYPNHSLAAQIIGFVGLEEEGLAGVEFTFQQELDGEPGWLMVQRDARGKPHDLLGSPVARQVNGRSLRLTIDAELQEIVEDALRHRIEESGARNGCVVAVDPASGRVLALANHPNVDLSAGRGFQRKDFLNLATNMPFEPGSTFKVFVAAALLEGRHAALADSIFCENGSWQLGRRTLRDVHPLGKLSFAGVIEHSSNIGMAKLVQRIPDDQLYRSLRAFGFGAYTGCGFSGEDRGYLPLPAQWSNATKTSLAMGYNVLVTPLQMAMAYAALANGGFLCEPGLVEEVFDEQGRVHSRFQPRQLRRVLPEALVRRLVMEAMVPVVETGTGTAAQVPGFRVAGKTGTSMKANPGGGYGHGGYVSSFGGFFPAEDPQIAIYILINDPDFKHRWGGSCAAPVFSDIIRATLLSGSTVLDRNRLELVRDRRQLAAVPPAAETPDTLPAERLLPPSAAAAWLPDSSALVMPDLTGLSIRRAVSLLDSLELRVAVRGAISVTRQHPQPGTLILPGETVVLTGNLASGGDEIFSLADNAGRRGRKSPTPSSNPGGSN